MSPVLGVRLIVCQQDYTKNFSKDVHETRWKGALYPEEEPIKILAQIQIKGQIKDS